ncbi:MULTISPECIES: acyl-CoA synthetase [Micromonospora]|uniref:Acyl-CoA synthetase n=1 Tax=Micromonospora solifontis TaxID=2487138 RepID=A0ABX9WAB9_9ACTN|nr:MULTISPECIES: acyl-CoA synthetase [Micromonospora]NES16216.1 acyl-CoA synthetase [Micromonospora sp. PPF5-17B]NES39658.1 acyl-CoA synthetase [Micromonospora solifontis]NES57703.1 acyl-CoA synthetase [Micromonospora sp. PPF5-6]RNL87765.1 acyl-CoA synthetase [Micromonospora solifontis]
MALLTALSHAPDERPDAIRVAGRAIAGTHLLESASAVADRIRGLDRVAVEATATLETVVGIVGALLADVTVVPVPPDAGPMERAHILRDSAVAAVLDPAGVEADAGGLPVVPVSLRDRSATRHREPADDRPALILYTSGTTGLPKGVLLSRRAIAACLDGLADAWSWTPDDLLVHGLPLFHVHGLVLGVLGPLRLGSRLDHVGRPRPERYAAAGGSLLFGVPTVWSRVCADPAAARALRRARLLVSGSAPLSATVFDGLHALTGHRVVERYGMTETLITVSARADRSRLAGTVGWPLPGVQTRLVDDRLQPVPSDGVAMGELLVRGPTLCDGYLGRPDADAAVRLAGGWFRTGDVATIDPDGRHRIVGRAATDLIKSGGFRIGAGEVEEALLAHPAVREAAVVGVPDDELGQRVTAYVVADGAAEPELIDFVARQLAVHKRPRRIHFLDALPRNALGKVQKSRLG